MTEHLLPWRPHADAWLLVLALVGAYLYAMNVLAPRYAPGRRAAAPRQRLYFLLGVAALWLGSDWPLHVLAEHWFSAHMVQHMLYAFVAAPLLILGTPGWLFRRLLAPRPVRALVRGLTNPLVALVIFNGWAASYHWPAIVNLSVTSEAFHFAVHIVWVVAALVMWWPVLSPLPELPHLSYPARIGYLFGQSLLPTIPASFLTFGESAWYRVYARSPELLGLTAVQDQQVAGLLMKVGGGLLIWAVIAVLFFRWQKEEQSGGPDVLYWRDLAPDLEPDLELAGK